VTEIVLVVVLVLSKFRRVLRGESAGLRMTAGGQYDA